MKMKLGLVSVCFACVYLCTVARADDFEIARANRFVGIAGPVNIDINDPAIALKLSEMNNNAGIQLSKIDTSPTRQSVFVDYLFPNNDPLKRTANLTATYNRLKNMALAYVTPGPAGSHYNNGAMRDAVVNACLWMNANQYKVNTTHRTSSNIAIGNWYDWEIAVPLALNDVLILLYSSFTAADRTAITDTIYYHAVTDAIIQAPFTGANKMWHNQVLAFRGLVANDAGAVSAAVTDLNTTTPNSPGVLDLVTSGEGGFYADGSYIQHSFYAYNGGYGLGLIANYVNFTSVLSGTVQWSPLQAPSVNKLGTRLLASFEPFVYRNQMMDSVRGRNSSRENQISEGDARVVIGTFLQAAEFVPASDAARLRARAKYWLGQYPDETARYQSFSIPAILRAQNVFEDTAITPASEPTGYGLYSAMDRTVHRRPGWAASLAMFSSRRKNYEAIPGENKRSYHTGDGMLYLYDTDTSQYTGDFWPTVNPYYHQGTTVLQASTAPGGLLSSNMAFVGGVPSWEGYYGMALMRYSPDPTVHARKAWFFLDNQVFCLGADIWTTTTTNVRTVIANRKLTSTGTNAVTMVSGTSTSSPVAESAEPGTWYSTPATTYLHITGNVSGSDYGVYFPSPGISLDVRRDSRTHTWNEINNAGTTDLKNNKFYTATLNHGLPTTSNPGAYAYAILPGFSLNALQSYASAPEVTVLENSSDAQAIYDAKLGITSAVFWNAAAHTVGSSPAAPFTITATGKCAVFVTVTSSTLGINVTDPTQTNAGTVHISIGRSVAGIIHSTPGRFTVTSTSPTIELDVNVAGLAGQPATAVFGLTSTSTIIVDNATNTGGSTVSSTGTWTTSTATAGFNGTNYAHDGNSQGGKTFTFRPSIPSAGKYVVQIRYTSGTNRSSYVPVTIAGSSATHVVTIDQKSGGGDWVTLGSYNFAVGTTGTITVSNDGADGYVIADAVRLFRQ